MATLPSLNPLLPSLSQAQSRLQPVLGQIAITGKVVEAIGTIVKVALPELKIGELCEFKNGDASTICFGEVIGFDRELALVAIFGENMGLSTKALVYRVAQAQTVAVGDGLFGRVLDGLGNVCDHRGPITMATQARAIYAAPPDPLERQLITKPFNTQIRVLDSLLTVGEGQRMGIFAAAGVGKSTLLSQLIKGSECDVRVVALIGERGREVREFIEHSLGPEGMKNTIIVCATSDKSALERVRAAHIATTIAEHYRDAGKKVLLVMDSVTRFARALREIGLAAGEAPTRQGFPPSVFAALPRLLERSGMGKTGSITAFYTILVEGNDMTEPIADETRSILDGHIILSRDLAAKNHYPAIDVLASVSRVANLVATPEHLEQASQLRELLAAYQRSELLIRVGEYQPGSDPMVDQAIAKMPFIEEFLRQAVEDFTPWEQMQEQLMQCSL